MPELEKFFSSSTGQGTSQLPQYAETIKETLDVRTSAPSVQGAARRGIFDTPTRTTYHYDQVRANNAHLV
jgi:hypothetical protein